MTSMSAHNMSHDLELPVKTRRAGKPKVRTGCKTCKIRRVKCDETKPSCLRCVKYWGACDGYPSDKPKVPRQRPLNQTRSYNIVLQPRSGPRFESVQEHQFFQIFREDTSATLGGLLDSHMWNGLILQASEQESFVRDAVVAIGALTKTRHDIDRFRRMGLYPNEDGKGQGTCSSYEYPLQLYSKALKGMRQTPMRGDYGLRMSLISCLLVVCFEGIYGTPILALTHAEQGIKLLWEWMRKHGVSNHAAISSPAPDIIEDDLIHAFNRLDIQILTFFDTKCVESHGDFKNEVENAILRMPSKFVSLQQARTYWDLVMRRCCHFLATSLMMSKPEAESFSPLAEILGNDVEGSHETPLNAISLQVRNDREHYLEDISKWDRAFGPISQTFESTTQQKSLGFLGSSCLKIYSITTKMMLAGAFFDSETAYDSFLPDFIEILRLVEPLYEHLIAMGREKMSFYFDPVVLPSLFVVVMRCRDRVIRRRAIALLYSHAHREGTWDSIAVARVGEWIMAAEEEGVETVEIPDHRRARLTKLKIDLEQRKAQIRIFQREFPDDSDANFRETTLKW